MCNLCDTSIKIFKLNKRVEKIFIFLLIVQNELFSSLDNRKTLRIPLIAQKKKISPKKSNS